ncbi:L-type lectin-domain containing receptor [Vigna angularis]|uniref:L-type lectin-domain containing receptor n=1 Tax=Phaseolus angularis TaxID=3914 RepID=A0A8T0LDC4_PHAAN|nr:L-type lectin-domain containing receptor [Vigna angularis]
MAWWHKTVHNPILFCHAMRTIFILQILPLANSLSFDYPNFKNGDVKWEGDASVLKGAIQVTSNAIDQNNNYSVGRVTSFEQMVLWDMKSRKLADFSTKFSFVIFSEKRYYRDGMAFFLADPNLPLLKDIKEGGGLGLVDGEQVLNSTQHPFVAVEFDTFHNELWDPSGSTHVGLNFNSMKSNITKSWLTDIQIWNVYNCSIKYNSSTLNLSVSFTMYNDSKPVEEYISYKVDLRDHLPGRVVLGFAAATGRLYEVHTLRSWSFSSSLQSDDKIPPDSSLIDSKKGKKIGLWVGLGIGLGLALSLSGLVFTLLWKRNRDRKEILVFDDEFPKGTGPKSFSYNELASATNKFAESEKLGQGGFGAVYKGYLKDMKSYAAIKRISRDSKQGMKEYVTEVKALYKASDSVAAEGEREHFDVIHDGAIHPGENVLGEAVVHSANFVNCYMHSHVQSCLRIEGDLRLPYANLCYGCSVGTMSFSTTCRHWFLSLAPALETLWNPRGKFGMVSHSQCLHVEKAYEFSEEECP